VRLYGTLLAVTLGTTFCSGLVVAASKDSYTAQRAKMAVMPIQTYQQLSDQLGNHTKQIVEVQGVVSGTFAGSDRAGYLLRVDGDQTVILTLPATDPDVAIGVRLKVLARIPDQGVVLDSVSQTRQTAVDTQPSTATTVADVVNTDNHPPTVYYKPPDKLSDNSISWRYTESAGLARQPAVIAAYAGRIKSINGALTDDMAQKIAFHLLDKSERNGVDPRLTFALVTRESRFNPKAISSAGAQGLGQLMPGTAALLGVHDSFDIEQNLDGAVHYLADMLRTFGRYSLALAAYNAGPNAVKRYGGVPPYRETQNYVQIIWKDFANLAGLDPDTGQPLVH